MPCCAGRHAEAAAATDAVLPLPADAHTLRFDLNTRSLDMNACMLVPASAASMQEKCAALCACTRRWLHVPPRCRQCLQMQCTVLQRTCGCRAVLHRHGSMTADARTWRHEVSSSSLLVLRCSATLLSPATTGRCCSAPPPALPQCSHVAAWSHSRVLSTS